MAKRILKDDVVEKGVLDNLLTPLGQLKTLLETTSGMLMHFAKNAKESLAFKTDAKGLREQEALMKKINTAYESKIKTDKELIKVAKEIEKTEKENIKLYEAAVKSAEKRSKAEETAHKKREAAYNAEIAKATELNRPYVQLDTTLKKLRKEYQDLAAGGLSNTKRAKELRGEITKLDTTLKKIDAETGVYTRKVGGYTEALKKGFQGAKNVIAQFGLALGGIALARSAIDTIVQFDSSIADLSAITGKTGKDLDFFRENAIKMGVDVKGGASAVVEAYKLIASAKPELLDNASALNSVTEAAILLSRASGMELPEAATALTDAMNQFGAGADQAGKFVDVLAAGAKFGSAEIPQITDALLKFGAVAKTSNVNIQESTALIEDLAEKGLKGADAGTALRNVMLKLSAPDALPKEAQVRLQQLGVDFDVLRDKSKPFSERLEQLKPLLHDNAALVKTFGTENAVAATTLISTTDRIKELTKQVDENGVAQDQANARSQTLSESYNRFKETINGLVLEFANGSNAAGGFVSALDFLRENISTIIATAYELLKAFVIFKGVMKTMQAVEFVKMNGGLREMAKGLTSVKKGSEDAGKGFGSFGTAIKGIGLTVLIDALWEVGKALYDVATGADVAREKLLAFESTKKSLAFSNEKEVKSLSAEIELERKRLELLVANGTLSSKQGAEKLKQFVLDKKYMGEQAASYEGYKKGIIETTAVEKNYFDRVKDRLKILDDEIQLRKASINSLKADGEFKNRQRIGALNGEINALKDSKNALYNYNNELKEIVYSTELTIQSGNDLTISTGKQAEAIEDYTQKLRELNDTRINDDKLRDEAQLKTKLDADLASIKGNGIKEYEYRMALEHTYQDDLLKLQKEYVIKRIEAEQEYWDAVKEAQLQSKADFEATEDEKFNQEVKAITDRDKQLELISLQNAKDGQKTDEAIEKEKLKRKKESLKQEIETERFYGKETIDLELELARLERDEKKKLEAEQKEADDKERARLERMEKFRNELIRMGTEYLTNQINEQIALLEKRSDKSAQLEDLLMEKAKAGNISASESIIEQQRIQEDADRKKIELERRKANIVAISSLLQSFNNKVNNGDKFALAETAVESGALLALLNSLPKFYGGTDTTVGAESKALKPGKDGHLSWVDKDERILNPSLSGKIPANVTNAQLVDGYLDSISGKFGTGAMMYKSQKQDIAGNSFDIMPLIQAQKATVDAINELPKYQLTPEQIAEGMIRLTAQTQRGKVKVKNEYIIRK